MKIILEILWLMLPAYSANMFAGLFRNTLKFLGKPVDMGKTWKGKRILGEHKTYRGFVVGVFFAIIFAFLQNRLYAINFFNSISLIDYSKVSFVALGFFLGFGALLGDSVESFFKRRIGKKEGEKWFPFDQLDWVIGSLALLSFIYVPDVLYLIAIVVIFPLLHVIINHIAFYLKIRDKKW